MDLPGALLITRYLSFIFESGSLAKWHRQRGAVTVDGEQDHV